MARLLVVGVVGHRIVVWVREGQFVLGICRWAVVRRLVLDTQLRLVALGGRRSWLWSSLECMLG